jgi:tetratricopeptide (TPR) repeat protein
MRCSRRRLAGLFFLALLPGLAGGQAGAPSPASAAVEAYYRGYLESSARSYREILKEDPWDLGARRNLVRLLREGGQPGEALGHLELLLLLRPQEPSLRLAAAESALLAGQPERGLGYLRTLEPSAEAGYLTGLAMLDLERRTEAAPAQARSGRPSSRWPGTAGADPLRTGELEGGGEPAHRAVPGAQSDRLLPPPGPHLPGPGAAGEGLRAGPPGAGQPAGQRTHPGPPPGAGGAAPFPAGRRSPAAGGAAAGRRAP